MQDETQIKEAAAPKKRVRRSGLWLLATLFVFFFLVFGGAILALGKTITAPEWVRVAVTDRISEAVPGIQVDFGDMNLTLAEGGQAEVGIQDIAIVTQEGVPVLNLSDVISKVSAVQLLRGKIELEEIDFAGAFVTLRRDRAGRVGLAFGDALPTDGELPDIPTLVRMVDDTLADSRLAGLKTINAAALTVRYEDARAQRAWTVDGGRLKLERDQSILRLSGDFALLGGGADVAILELNAQSVIGQTDFDFGLNLQNMRSKDIATQSAAMSWLTGLRAPISGTLQGHMFADGAVGPLQATLQIGQGALQPNNQTRPVKFSGARTEFTYTPDTATLSFAEISVDSAWGNVFVTGKSVFGDMKDGLPETMLGQFVLTDIVVKPEPYVKEPITVSRAEMDFRLNLNPFKFSLGSLTLEEDTLQFGFSGELTALSEGWQLGLNGSLATATAEQVKSYWPENLKPKARDWFTKNVKAGRLKDAILALRIAPGTEPFFHLDMAIEDATVRYAKDLPVASEAFGQFSIHDNRLVAMVDRGIVDPGQGGLIDGAGTNFVIPDIRIKKGPAFAEVKASSTVTAALAFLNSKPLQVMSKANLPVDLATGQVQASGRLDFPLRKGLKPEDIVFAFEGQTTGAVTDRLIEGRRLSAPALSISATSELVQVAGRGRFDDLPFEGVWRQPLGQKGAAGSVSAKVSVSQNAVDRLGIEFPKGVLSGQAEGQLSMSIAKDQPVTFNLTSDLKGLGASVPQIGWTKAKSAVGTLEVSGVLGKPASVDRLVLKAAGLKTSGKVDLKADGSLGRISFDRVTIKDWFDAQVAIVGQGKGQLPLLQVNGGSLDMRRAGFVGGSGATSVNPADSGPISLNLNSLRLSDGIELTNFRGDFTTSKGISGGFSAQVNGQARVSGSVLPQDGRSAVRITSSDAGKVLQAAKLLKSASGGEMSLVLKPVGQEGSYDGALDVKGLRLRDTPAIGALLDAISIVGLIDQLEGPGIVFSEVEARFRLTPDQLILTRSSAVGPSMGVSLDGYYNVASGALDFQGVLSPIYVLNGIGSIFGRKGEGLLGFNFKVKGSAETPKVSVNPFSILTPSMFREIFRRPPPKLSQ